MLTGLAEKTVDGMGWDDKRMKIYISVDRTEGWV